MFVNRLIPTFHVSSAAAMELWYGSGMIAERPTRTRLSRADRARQILDAARRMVVEQGTFPIPFDALGRSIGISKGLVYSYFPTQYDLANRLLAERLDTLLERGLEAATKLEDWQAAAQACATLYFDETAAHGPLLHILLSDLYLSGHLEAEPLRVYRRLMRRLARRLRILTGLSAREALSALHILTAVAEESGVLVWLNRLDADLGRQACREMVVGGVEGLLPAAR